MFFREEKKHITLHREQSSADQEGKTHVRSGRQTLVLIPFVRSTEVSALQLGIQCIFLGILYIRMTAMHLDLVIIVSCALP